MLVGKYQNSIDAKSRMIVPAKFREELGTKCVVSKALDHCLEIHPMEEWETFVNEKLKDDYEIIYIDRAGYGFSDDTPKTQTVEQIVSDYRNVLKNAGIEGPYILMPHSIGGVYATYWESVYPEEIEGVIFIDGTEVGMNVYDEDDYNIDFTDYLDLYLCKLGIQR